MSSYKENNYGGLLQQLVRFYQPKSIVEFGILDGYSLQNFVAAAGPDCIIRAYDIFEGFKGRHASRELINRFPGRIFDGDYYTTCHYLDDGTIDLLHIDIANDGDVYQFFFNHYIQKLSPHGIALLEGGSHERDQYDWMVKYNKPRIVPILNSYRSLCNIFVFQPFPSLTMISRRNND